MGFVTKRMCRGWIGIEGRDGQVAVAPGCWQLQEASCHEGWQKPSNIKAGRTCLGVKMLKT